MLQHYPFFHVKDYDQSKKGGKKIPSYIQASLVILSFEAVSVYCHGILNSNNVSYDVIMFPKSWQ